MHSMSNCFLQGNTLSLHISGQNIDYECLLNRMFLTRMETIINWICISSSVTCLYVGFGDVSPYGCTNCFVKWQSFGKELPARCPHVLFI